MTTITILPEKADSYRALAGDKESTGRTAGEALDALTSQLSDDEGSTLIIVQNRKADEFFNAAQQQRLTELMQLRQIHTLSSEEEEELLGLVEAELDGARRRTEWTVAKAGQEQHGDIAAALSKFANDKLAEVMSLRHSQKLPPEEIALALDADDVRIRNEMNRFTARISYLIRELLSQEEVGSEGEEDKAAVLPVSDERKA